jgi:hypothetical protein
MGEIIVGIHGRLVRDGGKDVDLLVHSYYLGRPSPYYVIEDWVNRGLVGGPNESLEEIFQLQVVKHPGYSVKECINLVAMKESMNEVTRSVPFRTQVGVVRVKREQILAAMKEFDLRFRSTEDDSGRLYAVEEEGRQYPPKRILELATGVPRNKFYGGKPSNDVFVGLGFHIVASDGSQSGKTAEQIEKEQARLNEPIPDVNRLVEDLFARTWVRLDDDSANLPDSQYPGVYVLAYPDEKLLGHPVKEDLTGDRVTEDEIFYVGMSHAGVGKRLRQFTDGLEDGGHHAGAKRFFMTVANQTPYSSFAQRKPFFVASISVPCTCLKAARSPMDLRKMGVVAQLEWYVLARVRERAKTKTEPWLNKK